MGCGSRANISGFKIWISHRIWRSRKISVSPNNSGAAAGRLLLLLIFYQVLVRNLVFEPSGVCAGLDWTDASALAHGGVGLYLYALRVPLNQDFSDLDKYKYSAYLRRAE